MDDYLGLSVLGIERNASGPEAGVHLYAPSPMDVPTLLGSTALIADLHSSMIWGYFTSSAVEEAEPLPGVDGGARDLQLTCEREAARKGA